MSLRSGHSDDRTQFDDLNPSTMIEVNRYCDQLESLWKQNQDVTLDRFLTGLPQSVREAALPELIRIDLGYRQQFGLPCSAELYLSMFPKLDRVWLDRQTQTVQQVQLVANATAQFELPQQLGDYLITGTLGSGGMGDVYRAEHKLMGRIVALKVLKASRLHDVGSRQRFEREVRVIAKLSHTNIVTAYDAREEGGMLYLVTELVDGEDLARLVKRKGTVRPVEAMYYIWQAAKGLAYAHRQGIIHRDIKPGNLLLDRKKTIKVLDLGLARLRISELPNENAESTITNANQLVGTAAYLAPEQARSPLDFDERSDIYSLGCTLFCLLYGRAPFHGATDIETIMAHLEQPIPELPRESGQYKLPNDLILLLRSMLAKSPLQRPKSMAEVVAILAGIIRVEQQTDTAPLLSPISVAATNRFDRFLQPLKSSISSAFSDSRSWIAGWLLMCALAFLLVGAAFIIPQFRSRLPVIPPQSVLKTPLKKSSGQPEWSGGLVFDGQTSYVHANTFYDAVASPFRIELATIPKRQTEPANLVTCSGPQCFALFVDQQKWGVACYDGRRSRLRVSTQQIRYDQPVVVAAEWNGEMLDLYLNGIPIQTVSIEYPMQPGPTGLYIGGLPPGVIPDYQGVRFYRGTIVSVRIQQGELSAPAATLADLRNVTPRTLALFPFSERSGVQSFDRSPAGLRGDIFAATWGTSAWQTNE